MMPDSHIKEYKRMLREEMRFLRSRLSLEEKSRMDARILEKFLSFPKLWEEEAVYLYASMKGEADTWALMAELWKSKITVALPRVEGKDILFYIVDNKYQLSPGSMGISEPDFSCRKADFFRAPVITPGLVFSPDGKRIGYGGGYYDRFFALEPDHPRIGASYPFQVKRLDMTENHDVRLHYLVTPDTWIECQ